MNMMSLDCCQEEIHLLLEELEKWTQKSKELKKEYQNLLVRNLEKDLLIDEMQQRNKSKKYISIQDMVSAKTFYQMRFLSDSKSDDSHFVHLFLNDIYGTSLRNKTLSGTNGIPTEIMEKLAVVFEERLNNFPSEEIMSRISSMKKCVRNAIDKAKRGITKESNRIKS